jgi:hypothetical protein
MEQRNEVSELEEVSERARGMLLEFGSLIPVVTIFQQQQEIMVLLADFPPKGLTKEDVFQTLGREVARQGIVVQSIYFAAESWVSVFDKQGPPLGYTRPSTDPHRQEMLTIFGYTLENKEYQLKLYKMHRDAEDKVVEVTEEPLDSEGSCPQSSLVNAFLEGYQRGPSMPTGHFYPTG